MSIPKNGHRYNSHNMEYDRVGRFDGGFEIIMGLFGASMLISIVLQFLFYLFY